MPANSVFPLTPIVCGIASAAFLIFYLAPRAHDIGLIDKPSGRKTHKNPIPLVGGIAIIAAFFLSLLLLPASLGDYRFLFLGVLILGGVGVLDDLNDISPATKFFFQALVAIVIVKEGGLTVSNLGDIWGLGHTQSLGVLADPITVVVIVGVINAFNMVDGLDGLVGMLALIALGFLAYAFFTSGDYDAYQILLVFIFILVTFLVFNLASGKGSIPKVFIGDSGSLVLGLVVIFFLIKIGTRELEQPFRAPIAPWLIAIPIVDTVAVISIRIFDRRSPFVADRVHLHHLLLNSGLNSVSSLLLIVGSALFTASIGFIGGLVFNVPDRLLFSVFMALLFSYTVLRLILFNARPSS